MPVDPAKHTHVAEEGGPECLVGGHDPPCQRCVGCHQWFRKDSDGEFTTYDERVIKQQAEAKRRKREEREDR